MEGSRTVTRLATAPPTAEHAEEGAADREAEGAAPSHAAATAAPDPAGSTLDRPTPDRRPR